MWKFGFKHNAPLPAPDASQPIPPKWPYWLVALTALLLYMILAATIRADPVPDRVEANPPTSRGQPELRDPSGSTPSLTRLLRSCLVCHGERGSRGVLFDGAGRMLPSVPRERFLWGVDVVIKSGPEASWFPSNSERRDLIAARDWLLSK